MPATSYNQRIAEVILELGLYPAKSDGETGQANLAIQKSDELIGTYEKATGGKLNEATCQMLLDALRSNYRIPSEA
jgi:hypothetical protein